MKSALLQAGIASAVIVTVTFLFAARVGSFTSSGFVESTMYVAAGSSVATATLTLLRYAGSATSAICTPTPSPIELCTSSVYVIGVTVFVGATLGWTPFVMLRTVYGWNGQLSQLLL